jgi:hypothetical protein
VPQAAGDDAESFFDVLDGGVSHSSLLERAAPDAREAGVGWTDSACRPDAVVWGQRTEYRLSHCK